MLDILGFSELVEERPAKEIFSIIERALHCTHDWTKKFPYWPLKTIYFSDTFLVYYEGEEFNAQFSALVDVARKTLTALLSDGVPVRGAITFGQFEMRDSQQGETVFFGKALIDAAKAEKTENWIGVLATPSCWRCLQKEFGYDLELDEQEHRWLRRADGALLLNPLGLPSDAYAKLKNDLKRPVNEWKLREYPTAIWAFKFLVEQARRYSEAGDFSSREAAKYQATLAFLKKLLPQEQYEWLEQVAPRVPSLSVVRVSLC